MKKKLFKKTDHPFLIILLAFLLLVVIYLNSSLFNDNLPIGFSSNPGGSVSGLIENGSYILNRNFHPDQDESFDELTVNTINIEQRVSISGTFSQVTSDNQLITANVLSIQKIKKLISGNFLSNMSRSLNQNEGSINAYRSCQTLNDELQPVSHLAINKNKSKRSTTLSTQNDSIHPSLDLNYSISDIRFPVGLTSENNSVFRSSASDPGDPGGPPEDNPIPVPDGWIYLLILVAIYTGWKKCFCNYNCNIQKL